MIWWGVYPDSERRIFARDLKAASEYSSTRWPPAESTAQWHKIICNSMGSLEAIMKKRVAAAA